MAQSASISAVAAPAPGELPLRAKALAFGAMSLGFFIALLDIQIVSASLKDIGGGLSASPDELSWVQTSYLIAEIVVIPLSGWLSPGDVDALAVLRLGGRLYGQQPALRWAWNIESMIAFRALQGFLGGSMIPTRLHRGLLLFLRPAARGRGGDHRRHLVAGADPRTHDRRLDHR